MTIATKPDISNPSFARDKVMVASFPCRIIPAADGTYQPSPDGRAAVGVPVYDRLNRLVDLVVWLSDAPSPWWFRHGNEISLLGARRLAVAAYFGDEVKLFSTPYHWLQAGGDGVAILKWGVDHRDLFEGVSRVDCDCLDIETHFRHSLRRWEPRLTSPRGVRHVS